MRIVVLAIVLAGCRTQPFSLGSPAPSVDLAAPDLVARDLAAIDLEPADLTRPHYCNGIYVFDEDDRLSFFDPVALTFVDIATLSCATSGATPFSMALGRDGTAWVEYTDGRLYRVDSTTGACAATSFVPGQQGFQSFGMGFASDAAGSTSETLYIANDYTTNQLGKIDLATLTVEPIAPLPGDAELTGTGSGELWGFIAEPHAQAGHIDKTTGNVSPDFDLSQLGDVSQDGFAFGYYAGSFYLFLESSADSTTVYRIDQTTGFLTTALVSTGRHVVGAGVSTCAPTQ